MARRIATALATFAIAGATLAASACTRAQSSPPEHDGSRSTTTITSAPAPTARTGDTQSAHDDELDPATAAAAEHAVVPDVRPDPFVPPPIPHVAKPPEPAATATPAAPQTRVPVTPRGRALPDMVPAEMPLGAGDAGATDSAR